MSSRRSRIQKTQLLALTFIGVFIMYRYSHEQPTNSKILELWRNTTSSPTSDNISRDGAFYSAADQARRDEDWEKKFCPLRELYDLNDLFEYIYTKRVSCDIQLMLGGHLKGSRIDGDKWICIDKKFNISPSKCLVFSFGIGHDWSFEDDVEAKLGCKVFAFDPTIKEETHNRTAKISFFNLGINDSNHTSPDAKIKMDRYINILSMLGHINSTIDILKIDVEGTETRVFKDVLENTPNLLKNVKMLSMEVHMANNAIEMQNRHKTFWKYFQLLDCFGFKIWYSAINPFSGGRVVNGRHRSCCYEIVWVQDRHW